MKSWSSMFSLGGFMLRSSGLSLPWVTSLLQLCHLSMLRAPLGSARPCLQLYLADTPKSQHLRHPGVSVTTWASSSWFRTVISRGFIAGNLTLSHITWPRQPSKALMWASMSLSLVSRVPTKPTPCGQGQVPLPAKDVACARSALPLQP